MLGELPLPEEGMVVISESGDISAQNVRWCSKWQAWEHVKCHGLLSSLFASRIRKTGGEALSVGTTERIYIKLC